VTGWNYLVQNADPFRTLDVQFYNTARMLKSWSQKFVGSESASRPLVGFGVFNNNLIKCLIYFVEVHEQILSNRYKSIHGYITQSTIMMQMELYDQCV
jgi:hypothetical protein